MLHFIAFDTMDVCRCLIVFMQVIEAPNITEIGLAHQFVSILSGFLDLVEHLNVSDVESGTLMTAIAWRQKSCSVACIPIHASLLGIGRTGLVLQGNLGVELSRLFLRCLDLAAERLAKLVKAVTDDHFEVVELSIEDMVRRLLVNLLLNHLDVAVDDLPPFTSLKDRQIIRTVTDLSRQIGPSKARCRFISDRFDDGNCGYGAMLVHRL